MKKLIALSLVILLLSGCGMPQYRAEYFSYFDTFTEVTFYCEKEDVEQIKTVVGQVFKNYHQLFDIYNTYPDLVNLKSINNLPTTPHKINPDLAEAIQYAIDQYEISGGKVNVAAGSVLNLWHQYRLEGKRLPPMDRLTSAASHINIDRVTINDNTIVSSDPMLKLDLGAIAKGYVSDKVIVAMQEAGATAGVVNMGGNVISFGKPNDRDYFVAGIQSPTGNGIAAKVKLKDASIVTSGSYQRFYRVDGKSYHHIIDMGTLMPGGDFASVSVMHPSSLTADFLSTTLFLTDLEQGKQIAQLYGAQVLWIYPDDTTVHTDDFPLIP